MKAQGAALRKNGIEKKLQNSKYNSASDWKICFGEKPLACVKLWLFQPKPDTR
jgi:hypothetical protein